MYFESGVTGEFWYQINNPPEDPAEETFGPIEARFGGWTELEIPFVNQSDARTTVDVYLSSRNFILDPNESKSSEIDRIKAGSCSLTSFVSDPEFINVKSQIPLSLDGTSQA